MGRDVDISGCWFNRGAQQVVRMLRRDGHVDVLCDGDFVGRRGRGEGDLTTGARVPAAAQILEHEPLFSVVLDHLVLLSKPLQNLLGHDGPALPILVDEAEDRLTVRYVRPGEENVPEAARQGRRHGWVVRRPPTTLSNTS